MLLLLFKAIAGRLKFDFPWFGVFTNHTNLYEQISFMQLIKAWLIYKLKYHIPGLMPNEPRNHK